MKIKTIYVAQITALALAIVLAAMTLSIMGTGKDWWGERVYVEGIIEDKSPALVHDPWVIIKGKWYHASKETDKLDAGYWFEGYLYEWT